MWPVPLLLREGDPPGMLIFIKNVPRAYAWGSNDALPALLGTDPNGEPQAELWLGAHPDDPATVAKAAPAEHTLLDLIESDPERYGVDGGQLPFLLKVLAIGGPLSLQVHPDRAQAVAGFAAEEAAGVPRDARERNYRDANHKPELLVALSEVTALSGFRPIAAVRADLRAIAAATAPGPGRAALEWAADLHPESAEAARRALMAWALGGGEEVAHALAAVETVAQDPAASFDRIDPQRLAALRVLSDEYAGDPGILVSLLLHFVQLEPGEAIYLGARQLHAYMGGIAVEVMAASDNVLRAGLTQKHVDVPELSRIVDLAELDEPRLASRVLAPGLVAWEPAVADFRLLRARLRDPGEAGDEDRPLLGRDSDRAEHVQIDVPYPLVLIVISGRVRVERRDAEYDEVASVRRGQSLYVSAGGGIELSGCGEVFLATVGGTWSGVSQGSTNP